ncbi:hypothetical protein GJAV_G00151690 [Gymnothorax javanicus]|nr:hypothetical protein GJAV_G00151690 [Gymnothorax javanicus]
MISGDKKRDFKKDFTQIPQDQELEKECFGRHPEDLTQIPQEQELEKECFGTHPEEWTSTHKVRELSVSDDDFEKQSFGRRPEEWTSTHKVRELSVSDDEYEIRSFGRRPDIGENEAGDWTPISQVPELHEEIHERYLDFPSLKRGTETELHDFGEMDQSMKKLIWGPLCETLKCPEALYALNCMLEEGSVSTGGSSLLEMSDDVTLKVDNLLKVMGLDSAESSDPPNLLNPLGLLVGSLSELDQEALTLILDLDGEDRGQVLKMVESVLEQVYSMDGGVPHWSSQFSENAIRMATQVLESCELYLDENGLDPSLGSHGAPAEGLISLYISLKGLDLLLGP